MVSNLLNDTTTTPKNATTKSTANILKLMKKAIDEINGILPASKPPIESAAPNQSIGRSIDNQSIIDYPFFPIGYRYNNKPISTTATNVFDRQYEYGALIAVAAIIFAFGLSANLAVIGRVLRQGVLRARIRMLLLSLSCADVLFMLLEFPLNQFAWMSTVSWRSGDFMCRASAFGRAFASYLISFILVVISLDRCLNTVKPAAPKAASRRMKKLLWSALLFAALCATPQWLIFHAVKIPNSTKNEQQCVSRGLVEDDNMAKVVYPIFCMICQYIIPIVLISLDYTIILYAMSKPVGQSDFQQLILFRQTSTPTPSNSSVAVTGSTRHNSSHDSYIRKAQMKTLRILLVTVAVFAMCWLPYYVVLLFYVGNSRLASKVVPYWVFKVTELIAVSNACVNPFIYGNYLLKVKERCKSCWP